MSVGASASSSSRGPELQQPLNEMSQSGPPGSPGSSPSERQERTVPPGTSVDDARLRQALGIEILMAGMEGSPLLKLEGDGPLREERSEFSEKLKKMVHVVRFVNAAQESTLPPQPTIDTLASTLDSVLATMKSLQTEHTNLLEKYDDLQMRQEIDEFFEGMEAIESQSGDRLKKLEATGLNDEDRQVLKSTMDGWSGTRTVLRGASKVLSVLKTVVSMTGFGAPVGSALGVAQSATNKLSTLFQPKLPQGEGSSLSGPAFKQSLPALRASLKEQMTRSGQSDPRKTAEAKQIMANFLAQREAISELDPEDEAFFPIAHCMDSIFSEGDEGGHAKGKVDGFVKSGEKISEELGLENPYGDTGKDLFHFRVGFLHKMLSENKSMRRGEGKVAVRENVLMYLNRMTKLDGIRLNAS